MAYVQVDQTLLASDAFVGNGFVFYHGVGGPSEGSLSR
jgi:hypothetical protein